MDYNALRLKAKSSSELYDILQAECRDRCKAKLSGTLTAFPAFRFPSLAVAQMATSDAMAAHHASWIEPGATVLDMTCGLGIDTFHAARVASHVTAIDINGENIEAAKHNAKGLGLDNIDFINADSVAWLHDAGSFDTILIDPARRDQRGRHVSLAQSTPDVSEIMPLLKQRCQRLIIKASPMLDISSVMRELGKDVDISILGTLRECKELCILWPGHGNVECETIGDCTFTFSPDDEKSADTLITTPCIGQFLYNPFPAVMKGGGFKTLSSRLAIAMPHPLSHLYISDSRRQDFPGEEMRITAVLPFDKTTVKHFNSLHPTINVATRNFPLTAPQLAQRLKVKEGGNERVYGTTLADGRKILVLAELVV